MAKSHLSEAIAELVHDKSVEILQEVGFCVPDGEILKRFSAAGFPVNLESQMVRITPDLLETALSMCGGLSSDAKELDAQAGFEKVVTAIPLLRERATIIYGVGATDAGSTISYTQIVFDDEIIAGIRRIEQGITLHDPSEEVALIKSRTPRGSFMSAPHTLRHYRQHWYPNIINRDTYATWLEKGETIESICRRKAQEIV